MAPTTETPRWVEARCPECGITTNVRQWIEHGVMYRDQAVCTRQSRHQHRDVRLMTPLGTSQVASRIGIAPLR